MLKIPTQYKIAHRYDPCSNATLYVETGGTIPQGCNCPRPGTFGLNCTATCDCHATGAASCNADRLGDGTCNCATNWYGPKCSFNCNAATTCSGNGVCSNDNGGECKCTAPASGSACSCPGCGAHGSCTADPGSRCNCTDNYLGNACQFPPFEAGPFNLSWVETPNDEWEACGYVNPNCGPGISYKELHCVKHNLTTDEMSRVNEAYCDSSSGVDYVVTKPANASRISKVCAPAAGNPADCICSTPPPTPALDVANSEPSPHGGCVKIDPPATTCTPTCNTGYTLFGEYACDDGRYRVHSLPKCVDSSVQVVVRKGLRSTLTFSLPSFNGGQTREMWEQAIESAVKNTVVKKLALASIGEDDVIVGTMNFARRLLRELEEEWELDRLDAEEDPTDSLGGEVVRPVESYLEGPSSSEGAETKVPAALLSAARPVSARRLKTTDVVDTSEYSRPYDEETPALAAASKIAQQYDRRRRLSTQTATVPFTVLAPVGTEPSSIGLTTAHFQSTLTPSAFLGEFQAQITAADPALNGNTIGGLSVSPPVAVVEQIAIVPTTTSTSPPPAPAATKDDSDKILGLPIWLAALIGGVGILFIFGMIYILFIRGKGVTQVAPDVAAIQKLAEEPLAITKHEEEREPSIVADIPYQTDHPILYPDGSRYEGWMLNGKKHGLGKYVLADGSSFVGQFLDGVVDGYGKIEWVEQGFLLGEGKK